MRCSLGVHPVMQPSIFNVRVPLPDRDEVFLMNTLTDAQLIVASEVAALLDRAGELSADAASDDERDALNVLQENGFLVSGRDEDRDALDRYFAGIRHDTDHLQVTVLTTLQC